MKKIEIKRKMTLIPNIEVLKSRDKVKKIPTVKKHFDQKKSDPCGFEALD